ncbi:MAG: hypothetical protein GY941_27815 [Planctomycetes bacterium]|nr:hypothetical protein [Planctomycetota bacterium]
MDDIKIPKFIGFACAFIMVITSLPSYSICDRLTTTFYGLGYRPVKESCCPVVDGEKGTDDVHYKEWCEKMFDNGSSIYQAYKDIAFNIEYTPEADNADFWQAPDETMRLKKGDCEDAVFVFYSHLPKDQGNAKIVWGWVVDKKSAAGRAHVWYQLVDRKGKQWVVEGFSGSWNGIIPMEEIEKTESRRSILTLPHLTVRSFAGSRGGESREINLTPFISLDIFDNDLDSRPFPRGFDVPSFPNSNREVRNIISKLQELFSRYKVPQQVIASKVPQTNLIYYR